MRDAPRTHSLASCYENALTTIVRLGTLSPGDLPNAQTFRESIKVALRNSLEKGKSLGYSNDANQTVFFPVVALLDESVLRLQSPGFASWAQRPLQEELFGHNRAGEVFFENLRGVLNREDSPEIADALEVYTLCLLLGFRGKYALSGGDAAFFQHREAAVSRPTGEIDSLIRQMREKMARIRGRALFLQAEAPAPEVRQTSTVDRWSRGLGIAALCLFVLASLALAIFWVLLNAGASQSF
jgi:type VI secretion system protein ImpK